MPGPELTLLAEGSIELLGLIPRSSNQTFFVQVSCGDNEGYAVYKPEAGERPLSDFEPGLYKRERAAYLLSESLGWGFVPPTVIREDAPLGVGSLQWFVVCDFQQHYFTLFDYVANNTDRKSGHVLRGDDGRIWGIDHGLCLSAAFKLRTVIRDFAGEPIPDTLLEDIAPLAEAAPPEVARLLDDDEVTALQRRVQRALAAGVLPVDRTGIGYPWPLV